MKTTIQKTINRFKDKIRESAGASILEMVVVIVFAGLALVAVMNLYSTIAQGSSDSYIVSQASILAQGKLEDIISDRNRQDRGFPHVTTPGQYPVQIFGDFTITTVVEPDGHQYNSVSYALVEVSVSHASLPTPVKLAMWLTEG